MDDYSHVGHATYGNKCEFDGCGWNAAQCDVHHISYQQQQALEVKLRRVYKARKMDEFSKLMTEAKAAGYPTYDAHTGQLSKDNRSTNLSVLCPNHHRYVHSVDMGMDVLKHLPPRK